MSQEPIHVSPVFRIDVSAEPSAQGGSSPAETGLIVALLREMLAGQAKQNKLLQDLIENTANLQKQRQTELQQWKDANPRLAKACHSAAETLSRVQTQFLETMTEEIAENEDNLIEGDFMLNEFVDRFGPRMAHLNGVLQVLAQLGSGVPASN